ncbi:MAG TPA: hypothetical protein VGM95_04390 [Lactobacillaceae bacterium]|jgi:hypothetical protein
MSEDMSRRSRRNLTPKDQKQREKERIRVEKAYAKAHPTEITVIQPEKRAEIRLTRNGRYELGSDGKLTPEGKSQRLAHRYNVGIVLSILGIIAVYTYFFVTK